jgi:hypothetical protein
MTFFSESQDNRDKAYLIKKKMVGKRLNKLIEQCQLNWQIIDCVEELTTNFLTNTVQEENLNILIDEINKEYILKFSKKKSASGLNEYIPESSKKNSNNKSINEKISQRAKVRFNEMKRLNLDEIDVRLKSLRGTDVLPVVLQGFKELADNYERDIMEDEREFENLDLQIEEGDEFTNIIEKSKEIISRLGVILENAEESS